MRVPKSGLAKRAYFWILGSPLLSSRVIVFPYQANPKMGTHVEQFKKTARNYGGHFIEASIGMVFQVRFWEHGKVAMGSCSLLPSQLW